MNVPNVEHAEQSYGTLNPMIRHPSIYSLISNDAYAVVLKMCFLDQQRQHHLGAS